MKSELLIRSRIFLFDRRESKPHILTNSTKESSRVSFFNAILRHGTDDPEPDLEVGIHVQTGPRDLHVRVPFAACDGKLYQFIGRVSNVFAVSFTFSCGLEGWNKEAEPHKRHGLNRAGAVDIQLTTSPDDLSTSSRLRGKSFFSLFICYSEGYPHEKGPLHSAVNGNPYPSKCVCISQY